MATLQTLLLTVVLILPSVESLFFRNPQYSVTLDQVRDLGRLCVTWVFMEWLRDSVMLLKASDGHQ